MKALKARITKGLTMGSRVATCDNSGAKVIKIYSVKRAKTVKGRLASAGVGDFPLAVIAPRTIAECYSETKRAFYLAEKYQLPVIVLVDKHLTESFQTVSLKEIKDEVKFNFNSRINLINEVKLSQLNKDGLFPRYQGNNLLRPIPGTKNGVYTSAGDEHDEVGEITENKEIRIKMMNRRMSKLPLLQKELPKPQLVGTKNAKITLVCWGSTTAAVAEAVAKLNSEKKSVNYLALKNMFPFQEKEVQELLKKSKKLILVENNYSGQLGELIRAKTGIELKNKVLRSDGATFSTDDLIRELKPWSK